MLRSERQLRPSRAARGCRAARRGHAVRQRSAAEQASLCPRGRRCRTVASDSAAEVLRVPVTPWVTRSDPKPALARY
eukprot:scaffold3586_cov404-Prasinococcus_capsulatus_cf.AAC.21